MNCHILITTNHHGKTHTLRDAESISRTLATECAVRIRKFLYRLTFSCLTETWYKQFVFQLPNKKKMQIHADFHFKLEITLEKN